MKKEIINPILRIDIDRIVDQKYPFEKGGVSGFSIEIFIPETESYSSYIYYDDEKNRDNDFEILCKFG